MDEIQFSGNKDAEALIQWGRSYWMETCFERVHSLKPCPLGATGACCRVCHLGPCRFTQTTEDKVDRGVCGDKLSTVVARNLLRMAIYGAGVYVAQARELTGILHDVSSSDEAEVMDIRNEGRLYRLADELGIQWTDKKALARAVSEALMAEIGRQYGRPWHLRYLPQKALKRFEHSGIVPEGIEKELSEALFRAAFGGEHDPYRLILAAMKVSIGAALGGSMIITSVSDVLFNGSGPVTSEAGFGVLKEDEVNIVVAGQNPVLLWSLVNMASSEEMVEYARSKGANGINISNIFCMRYGSTNVGGFTNQELCLLTGIVDAVVLDSECIMPTVVSLSESFHTKVISTSTKAYYPGSEHIPFNVKDAKEITRKILTMAIDNYPQRTGMGERAIDRYSFQTGFTEDCMMRVVEGSPFYAHLTKALQEGRLRGLVCLVGCDNPRLQATAMHIHLAKELLKEDVLILTTGCASTAFACAGVMEYALEHAGEALKDFIKSTNMPPVLHLGSCSENGRIILALRHIASQLNLREGIAGLPVVVVSPEWVTEKEVTMAFYFAASGMHVIMGGRSPVKASDEVQEMLTERLKEDFRGMIVFEENREKIFDALLNTLDERSINSQIKGVDRDDGQTAGCQ